MKEGKQNEENLTTISTNTVDEKKRVLTSERNEECRIESMLKQ